LEATLRHLKGFHDNGICVFGGGEHGEECSDFAGALGEQLVVRMTATSSERELATRTRWPTLEKARASGLSPTWKALMRWDVPVGEPGLKPFPLAGAVSAA
jgi:hypothetical protein